jgi:hypothetical protein
MLGRLGWPGLSGLVALVVAGMMLTSLVQPMQKHIAELEARAAKLESQPAPVTPIVTVRDWRADLPAGDQAYTRLTRLFRAAEDAGLSLSEGSYRHVSDKKAAVQRLIVEMPVSGDYAAMRSFLAYALNQDESLALESVEIQRGSMTEAELEGDLRFVLFVGEPN